MKALYTPLLLLIPFISNAQALTSHNVYASNNMIFSPSDITINIGDTVYFENLTSHNAVEVSEETYNNNGSESNGGFELYSDNYIVLEEVGTYYYVCTPHVEMGMKGIINVTEPVNIEGQWNANNGDYIEITSDTFFIYIFENEDCYELEEYSYELIENTLNLFDGEEEINPIIFNLDSNSFSLGLGTDTINLLSDSFNVAQWVLCDIESTWYCIKESCYEDLNGQGEFNSLEECQIECEEINEQKTYIPDDNFEQALIDLGYDNILDDYVLTSNIASVGELDISSKNISDLTGIQDFFILHNLDCHDNEIYSLDFSSPALEYLYCNNNLITDLNIESNSLLELNCSNNPLMIFDATIHPNLTFLEIYNTEINTIDLSQNLDLSFLSIGSNTNLLSLDLSNNYNLNHLDLWANNLSELDLRNGNNQNMSYFVSWNSQNLICISVDDSFFSANNWTSIDPWTYFSESCSNITSVIEHTESKELLKVKDLFGRETNQTNQLLFYIYDDGTVEKKVIIE